MERQPWTFPSRCAHCIWEAHIDHKVRCSPGQKCLLACATPAPLAVCSIMLYLILKANECYGYWIWAVDPWREEPMPEQVCWQDLWPRRGPTLEQSVPEGLHPVRDPHWSSSWRTAAREKDPRWRRSWRTVSRGKHSHWSSLWRTAACGKDSHWSGGRVWGGRSSRVNVWWTDHSLYSQSPWAPGGEQGEKFWSDLGVISSNTDMQFRYAVTHYSTEVVFRWIEPSVSDFIHGLHFRNCNQYVNLQIKPLISVNNIQILY